MDSQRQWPQLLQQLLDGRDLSVAQAEWAMGEVMVGEATHAQLAAFLVALRAKGESIEEVVGFRDAILAHAEPISLSPNAVDIVGTGGDSHGTVNVSTMASLVVAASGVPVVKHGNRAASSQSGSSDVLAALGVNIDLDGEQLVRVFDDLNLTFIWASKFHPGFRHAGQVRSELGIPTIFNILGPLCNPVRPIASAVGVADASRAELIAGVFAARGAAALVFRGDDGLDELSTTGHSKIWEISKGAIAQHDLDPREIGLDRASLDDLRGGDAEHNARVVHEVLGGARGAVRDIVVLNAAAGLVAYDLAQQPETVESPIRHRLEAKIEIAREAIDSGRAQLALERWVALTQT